VYLALSPALFNHTGEHGQHPITNCNRVLVIGVVEFWHWLTLLNARETQEADQNVVASLFRGGHTIQLLDFLQLLSWLKVWLPKLAETTSAGAAGRVLERKAGPNGLFTDSAKVWSR